MARLGPPWEALVTLLHGPIRSLENPPAVAIAIDDGTDPTAVDLAIQEMGMINTAAIIVISSRPEHGTEVYRHGRQVNDLKIVHGRAGVRKALAMTLFTYNVELAKARRAVRGLVSPEVMAARALVEPRDD